MMTTSKKISEGLAGLTGKLPILLLTTMLAACGGGGGGNDSGGGSSSSSSSGSGSSSSSSSGGDVDTQPQATDDTVTGDEDTDIVIDVLQNDDLGEDGISTLVVKAAPQYGQATVNDAGTPGNASDDTITYVPSVDFNGEDSFTYEISDTDGDVTEATVTVTVTPTAELSASAVAGGNGTNPKMLKISWTVDVPVDHYRVEVNPDGSSGFTDSGFEVISGNQTEAELEVPLHLTLWDKARLQLVALDQNDRVIERSNEIALDDVDTTSMIGYFKEARLDLNEIEPDRWITFGTSVAMSADGNVVAVGAPRYDKPESTSQTFLGGIFVFHKGPSGWTSYLKDGRPLMSDLSVSDEQFGRVISLSDDGKMMAVGLPTSSRSENGSDGQHRGAVQLHHFDESGGNGEWKFLWGKHNPADSGTSYGRDVSLSGDGHTLVISGGDGSVEAPSTVEVLKLDDAGGITDIRTLMSDDSGAIFNVSVSNDGGVIAIGSRKEVYVYSSEDDYGMPEIVTSSQINDDDLFGLVVNLSGDGLSLAIGSPGDDSSSTGINPTHNNLLENSGAAYLFKKAQSGWEQAAYVKPSHPEENAYFGSALSLSGDGKTLAIGSIAGGGDNTAGIGINPPHEGVADASGAVYTFYRDDNNWRQVSFIKASNTGAEDGFGAAISTSEDGSTMAVGAPWESSNTTGIGGNQEDDSNPSSGAVYIY